MLSEAVFFKFSFHGPEILPQSFVKQHAWLKTPFSVWGENEISEGNKSILIVMSTE